MMRNENHTRKGETMKAAATTQTRTVAVVACDFDDYVEYLAANGWAVTKTKAARDGRIVQVTFAY